MYIVVNMLIVVVVVYMYIVLGRCSHVAGCTCILVLVVWASMHM
jgi:hypothetical protein